MGISGFTNALNHFAILTGTASKLKESSGTQLTISPDGTVHYSSQATSANVTKNQQEYQDATNALKELEPYLDPPEDMFGLAAGKHSVTQVREIAKIIPGISANEKDVDAMALYNKFNANASLQIMKTAKTLAGARFSDADLTMIKQIMPQVGVFNTKADYMAKMDLIRNFLKQTEKTRAEILATGKYKIGTEAYDKEFSKQLPSTIEKAQDMLNNFSPEIESGIQYNMDQYGYTRDEAVSLMKNRGMIK
jgi:antitoxin component HigA of HigAB toxin-antitoxin module